MTNVPTCFPSKSRSTTWSLSIKCYNQNTVLRMLAAWPVPLLRVRHFLEEDIGTCTVAAQTGTGPVYGTPTIRHTSHKLSTHVYNLVPSANDSLIIATKRKNGVRHDVILRFTKIALIRVAHASKTLPQKPAGPCRTNMIHTPIHRFKWKSENL